MLQYLIAGSRQIGSYKTAFKFRMSNGCLSSPRQEVAVSNTTIADNYLLLGKKLKLPRTAA